MIASPFRNYAASARIAALTIIERHVDVIDLLLTDVVMPGMSGWLLVDTLATKHPGLPAIFMSGNPELVRAYNGGKAEGPTLPKPFTATTLLERVQQALDAQVVHSFN